MSRVFTILAAAVLLIATALGAYASHGLAARLEADTLRAVQTAIDYQFYHGLGLLGTAVLAARHPQSRWLETAGYLFLAGVVLFCGGIYATAFGAPDAVGRLTPLGGVSFMAAWASLACAAWRFKSS